MLPKKPRPESFLETIGQTDKDGYRYHQITVVNKYREWTIYTY